MFTWTRGRTQHHSCSYVIVFSITEVWFLDWKTEEILIIRRIPPPHLTKIFQTLGSCLLLCCHPCIWNSAFASLILVSTSHSFVSLCQLASISLDIFKLDYTPYLCSLILWPMLYRLEKVGLVSRTVDDFLVVKLKRKSEVICFILRPDICFLITKKRRRKEFLFSLSLVVLRALSQCLPVLSSLDGNIFFQECTSYSS